MADSGQDPASGASLPQSGPAPFKLALFRLARRWGPAARIVLNQADRVLHWRAGMERLLEAGGPSHGDVPLPEGAGEILRRDNPKLLELRERYRTHPAASGSLWNEAYLRGELDLRYFRGDNAYVWQRRGHNCAAAYALTAGYVRQHDPLGLMDRLEEDGLFGAHVFQVEGRTISRDLMDSVLEISFLEDKIGLSKLNSPTVLDIGAGYGRLGHRAASVVGGRIMCTDAVAVSTFLCDYYLSFRGVAGAETVPLDEVELALGRNGRRVDVAVNVHGLEECPAQVASWWLELLARHRVPWVFLVSISEEPKTRERSGERLPLGPTFSAHGFRQALREPKYLHSKTVQELGVYPAHYFLFNRQT
jgi:hypothetical protein